MKGIVFTEFLDMVEQQFGEETMENIIDQADLDSGGAYTAVGSYPAGEMVSLVQQLSRESGQEIPALLESFGSFLFHGLHRAYPHFFGDGDIFDFLASIHTYIHVEVQKLYADAELPNLLVESRSDQHIELIYESPRRMGDLARGLLKASCQHYQESTITIEEELLNEDGSRVKFTLTRN